jgi:hypothetical protein
VRGISEGGGAPERVKNAVPLTRALYYVGRLAQLVGMWLLLEDILTAGPLGPSPRLFALGIAMFVAGWALTRVLKRS